MIETYCFFKIVPGLVLQYLLPLRVDYVDVLNGWVELRNFVQGNVGVPLYSELRVIHALKNLLYLKLFNEEGLVPKRDGVLVVLLLPHLEVLSIGQFRPLTGHSAGDLRCLILLRSQHFFQVLHDAILGEDRFMFKFRLVYSLFERCYLIIWPIPCIFKKIGCHVGVVVVWLVVLRVWLGIRSRICDAT